jgi:hypothetical protein
MAGGTASPADPPSASPPLLPCQSSRARQPCLVRRNPPLAGVAQDVVAGRRAPTRRHRGRAPGWCCANEGGEGAPGAAGGGSSGAARRAGTGRSAGLREPDQGLSAALRHESHGGAPADGPRRSHRARLPLDLPRLGRGNDPALARGDRGGACASAQGQGRGGLCQGRPLYQAAAADGGLGRLSRFRPGRGERAPPRTRRAAGCRPSLASPL